MKTKYLALFFLLPFILLGQKKNTNEPTVKWGEFKKTSRGFKYKGIARVDNNSIYTIESVNRLARIYVSRYDHNLKLHNVVGNDIVIGRKRMKYFTTINIGNKAYVLTTFKDTKAKTNNLFIQTLNLKTLMLNEDIKLIRTNLYKEFSKSSKFSYALSNDSSKILIYNTFSSIKKSEKISIFDNNFNLLWEQNIALKREYKNNNTNNYIVDNLGNVHMIRTLKTHRKEKTKYSAAYYYKIHSYLKKGELHKEYIISEQHKQLKHLRIRMDNNQNIICAGLYGEIKRKGIAGVCFIKINNATQKIITKKYSKISVSYLIQNLSDINAKKLNKRAKMGRNILYDYRINNIIERDNGNSTIIAEQYIKALSTHIDAIDLVGNSQKHYYNNIMVININNIGEINWVKLIKKKQYSISKTHLSYSISISNDKIYFLFNDNPKNITHFKSVRIHPYRGLKTAVLSIVAIDNSGVSTQRYMINHKKTGGLMIPNKSGYLFNNEILFYAINNKYTILSKIVLNP